MTRRHLVTEQVPEGLHGDEQDMLGYLRRYQVGEDEAEYCTVEQESPLHLHKGLSGANQAMLTAVPPRAA
jgi:hypothetical protein